MAAVLGPLIAALLYAVATFFSRTALRGGVRTGLQFAVTNITMSLVVGSVALAAGGRLILDSPWPYLTALLFLLGNLMIFIALRAGDSSIQTPLMGMKVLFVPLVVSLAFGEAVPREIWLASVLAALAVFLIGFRRDALGSFHLLPIMATLAATLFFAGSDSIIAELSGPIGNFSFMATFLFLVCVLSVPVGVLALRRQLRDGAAPAWRPLLLGSVLMALQFAFFVSVLSFYSDAPRSNIIYSSRGLWSVLFLFLANALGRGHFMESVPSSVVAQRFAGAMVLVVAIGFAI